VHKYKFKLLFNKIKHTLKFNKIKIDRIQNIWCNAMHDLKSRIIFSQFLHPHHFFSNTPPWHQISKKLLIIFRRRWRMHWMIIRIWHITQRRRTMRKDIVEMVREPRELILNILHTCGEMAKLICERIYITPNNTKICIESIKVLHNWLMILLVVRWVKAGHTDLHTLLNDIHNLRNEWIKRIHRRRPLRLKLRLWRSIIMFMWSFITLIIC
jgi:hypothetical protein